MQLLLSIIHHHLSETIREYIGRLPTPDARSIVLALW